MKMKKILSTLLLSSLFAGNVLAAPNYSMRIPMDVPGITADEGDEGGGTEPPVPEADPSGWLAYFQSKNYLTELTDFNEWNNYNSSSYAQIDDLGHPNTELPSKAFGLTQLSILFVDDPYITNIDFLYGLNAAHGLYFEGTAGLSDIGGLRKLEFVNELSLADSNVSNISALSRLKAAGTLNFMGSPITDINPIKNLSDVMEISLDYDKNTFGPLLPNDSQLCKTLIDRKVRFMVIDKNRGDQLRSAYPSEICKSSTDAWLAFLHQFGKHTRDISIESIAANKNVSMDFSGGDFGNNGVTIHDGDIPSAPYPALLSGGDIWVDISFTELTNVDFLSTAKSFQGLNLTNNSKLKNLNGLSNLTEVSNLRLANTPDLTDISGLANIARTTSSFLGAGEITVDHLIFNKRPAIDSPFCQGMQSGAVNVQVMVKNGNSTWYEKAVYGSLCY